MSKKTRLGFIEKQIMKFLTNGVTFEHIFFDITSQIKDLETPETEINKLKEKAKTAKRQAKCFANESDTVKSLMEWAKADLTKGFILYNPQSTSGTGVDFSYGACAIYQVYEITKNLMLLDKNEQILKIASKLFPKDSKCKSYELLIKGHTMLNLSKSSFKLYCLSGEKDKFKLTEIYDKSIVADKIYEKIGNDLYRKNSSLNAAFVSKKIFDDFNIEEMGKLSLKHFRNVLAFYEKNKIFSTSSKFLLEKNIEKLKNVLISPCYFTFSHKGQYEQSSYLPHSSFLYCP